MHISYIYIYIHYICIYIYITYIYIIHISWWLSIGSDDDVMSCKTDLCVKVLEWEDRCTGAIPHSQPGKSWSSGTKNRYNRRLPGCSGWPGILWVPRPALGAPMTFAAIAYTTAGSSGELFRLFRRESGFACHRADITQFKLTDGLRLVCYPHLV